MLPTYGGFPQSGLRMWVIVVVDDLRVVGAAGVNGAAATNEAVEWDLVVPGRRGRPRIRTFVADHDPISRRVIHSVLGRSEQLEMVACVDSHDPLAEWPLRHVDVAVLGLTPSDFQIGTVRELVSRLIRVLLIGVDWTRRGLDEAVVAGATGCLVKDTDLTGIVGAVHAVACGNMVLSPELLGLHIARPRPGAVDRRESREAVLRLSDREREVLILLGEGMSTAEAANLCGVSNATIKSHVSHALTKLGARNRLEAVLMVNDAFTPATQAQLRSVGSPSG